MLERDSSRPQLRELLTSKGLAFLLCSFWLVACLAKMGDVEEAEANMNELLRHTHHLGLFAEEVDPKTGEALGNFPQAFSHMGLILAANALDRALDEEAGHP